MFRCKYTHFSILPFFPFVSKNFAELEISLLNHTSWLMQLFSILSCAMCIFSASRIQQRSKQHKQFLLLNAIGKKESTDIRCNRNGAIVAAMASANLESSFLHHSHQQIKHKQKINRKKDSRNGLCCFQTKIKEHLFIKQ